MLIYYSSIFERMKFEFFTNRYLNWVMKKDLNAYVHFCMSIKLTSSPPLYLIDYEPSTEI